MEIFQTIWTALTTENELLIKLTGLPLCFIDTYVSILFCSTILNIKRTKKTTLIYVITLSIIAFISRNFVPNPYGSFIGFVFWPILVFFIFKASLIQSILAVILPCIFCAFLESILLKLCNILFDISLTSIILIPIYRISISLVIYGIIFMLHLLAKRFNITILALDNLTKKTKWLLLIDSFLGILAIAVQCYLISFYISNMPYIYVIFSTIRLISYFLISIYSIFNITRLEVTAKSLDESNLYNKSLSILHDNIRGFKHDFDNIVQSIGGYVINEDMSGLKKYYSQLQQDCQRVNNIAALSPALINNSAIYSILASKYYSANEKGININLELFIDFNELEKNIKIYEFTRILGILLDNAIQAASTCTEKIINLCIRTEPRNNRQVLIICNTYSNKDINTEKIFEKGYSTKEGNSGLGLWEVRQILKKNNNLNLYTTKDNIYFNQQLEIYY